MHALRVFVEKAIQEDKTAQQEYLSEWDEIDERLNGNKVPGGFTQDHLGEMSKQNNPNIPEQQKRKSRSFVHAPQQRPHHESRLGDFVNTPRKLSISPNGNISDTNIAKLIQRRVEQIERVEMLPERVYFPAMDGAFPRGIHWIMGDFNPYARQLRGKQSWRAVSPRDVLVDQNISGTGIFDDMNRVTYRFKWTLDEAKERLRHLPLFDASRIHADSEYDEPYFMNSKVQPGDMATFYLFQFRRMVSTYYLATHPNPKLLTTEEAEELLADPLKRDDVILGGQDHEYYFVLYNTSAGILDFRLNKAGMFTLIPLVNIAVEGRHLPMGDVLMTANLADLLDTVITVLLDNAKKTNRPIGEVDPEGWDDEKVMARVNTALAKGGAAPYLKRVYQNQPVNSYLVQLMPWTMQLLQDATSRHSASQGQMPAKQVAKDTVYALMQADRQAQSRKDVMLKLALSRVAELMVKMICAYDEEEDFVELTDATVGSPNYVPINKVMTETAYIAMLQAMYKIPMPQKADQQQAQDEDMVAAANQQQVQFEQMLLQARAQFEETNDVKVALAKGFIWDREEETLETDMPALLDQIGLSETEFVRLYHPQKAMIRVYNVNVIRKDIELSVTYEIDTDPASNPQYKEQRAYALFDRKVYSPVDLLRDAKVKEPEKAFERAAKYQQGLQVAMQIAANPELYQAVMTVLQSAQSGQSAGKEAANAS